MSVRVAFVAQVGRTGPGAITARPKIESICAKNGGRIIGGAGSTNDPILAEFAEKPAAVAAAQEAWYLDDVEHAKVIGADGPGTNPVANIIAAPAIAAVLEGKDVKAVVDDLLK